jgi:hypothetical protein
MLVYENIRAVLFIILDSPVCGTLQPVLKGVRLHHVLAVGDFSVINASEVIFSIQVDILVTLFFRGSNFSIPS